MMMISVSLSTLNIFVELKKGYSKRISTCFCPYTSSLPTTVFSLCHPSLLSIVTHCPPTTYVQTLTRTTHLYPPRCPVFSHFFKVARPSQDVMFDLFYHSSFLHSYLTCQSCHIHDFITLTIHSIHTNTSQVTGFHSLDLTLTFIL